MSRLPFVQYAIPAIVGTKIAINGYAFRRYHDTVPAIRDCIAHTHAEIERMTRVYESSESSLRPAVLNSIVAHKILYDAYVDALTNIQNWYEQSPGWRFLTWPPHMHVRVCVCMRS